MQFYIRLKKQVNWSEIIVFNWFLLCYAVPIPCSADTPELKKSLRIERIVQFGVWLSENAPESTIKCINDRFVCQPAISDDANEDDKTDLMRNMAHLWLKSEVQELERKVFIHLWSGLFNMGKKA